MRHRSARAAIAAAAVASLGGGLLTAPAPAGAANVPAGTARVSAGSDTYGGGGRELSAVSATGRDAVFVGRSSQSQGVYLVDRRAGTTTRLTTGKDMNPALSPTGRYVAFARYGATRAVYLLDTQTKQLTLESVSSTGAAASGGSGSDFPSVSANGRYVAFQSTATNLGGPTVNGGGPNKVYVHDNMTGTTVMASVTSSNGGVNGNALYPDITPDGRYVAFTSTASNLRPTSTTTTTTRTEVYVHDLVTGTTTIASVSTTGAVANAGSGGEATATATTTTTPEAALAAFGPTISDNGRYVAFESTATNLVTGDTNGVIDAFVHDMVTGKTIRVSVTSTGAQAVPAPLPTGVTDPTLPLVGGAAPQVSGDGTAVAFESEAPLTGTDANGVMDVYTYTMATGAVERASVPAAGGTEASGTKVDGHTGATVAVVNGADPSVNADGQFVAFTSDGNLAADRTASEETPTGTTTNYEPAIFLRTRSGTTGYRLAASDGGIFSFGAAAFYGSMGGQPLNAPVVGLASTDDGTGYWEVARDGGIFAFGGAGFHGSMGGQPLNKPVVGMAHDHRGTGYWEVASDGGIFAFGSAGFYGSMGGKALNKPIVGMAPTLDGNGYWLVASDGGIFAFGDAGFYGSMGGKALNQPIVGMAATPTGNGYWLVASDGGIFAFGDAGFYGSMGGTPLNRPVVGVAASSDGAGYWEVASDGGIFAFGDAGFHGSMGGTPLNRPVIGVAEG